MPNSHMNSSRHKHVADLTGVLIGMGRNGGCQSSDVARPNLVVEVFCWLLGFACWPSLKPWECYLGEPGSRECFASHSRVCLSKRGNPCKRLGSPFAFLFLLGFFFQAGRHPSPRVPLSPGPVAGLSMAPKTDRRLDDLPRPEKVLAGTELLQVGRLETQLGDVLLWPGRVVAQTWGAKTWPAAHLGGPDLGLRRWDPTPTPLVLLF